MHLPPLTRICTRPQVAEDWRLDPTLQAKCQESVDTLCDGVEPGEGREIDCLAARSTQLSWDCLHQVRAWRARRARACAPFAPGVGGHPAQHPPFQG